MCIRDSDYGALQEGDDLCFASSFAFFCLFYQCISVNSKGFNTSAILGFVNTLEEVLKKENPTHIGVAFDLSLIHISPTEKAAAFVQAAKRAAVFLRITSK